MRLFNRPDIQPLPWIVIHSIALHPEVGHLDRGEAAAISLALAVGASAVVIDERLARQVAERLGLAVIGTLGVLLAAKRKGLIAMIKPSLVLMLQQGRYLSTALCNTLLRSAGEEEIS